MRNKNYEYKMTIDGREIGGSVNGPQATVAEVVELMKSHNPKATNVTAAEVKTAEPTSDGAGAGKPAPKPAALPAPATNNAEQKS